MLTAPIAVLNLAMITLSLTMSWDISDFCASLLMIRATPDLWYCSCPLLIIRYPLYCLSSTHKCLNYENRLVRTGLTILEERSVRGDLIEVFIQIMSLYIIV